MLEHVDDDDLDRSGDRNRAERPEHARERRADQHGHEDDERRELDGPSVHERLQEMVLDLLVDDEEDDATVEAMIAAIVAPTSGTRSRIPTSSPSASAKGTPMIQSTRPDVTPAIRLMKRLPVT